MEDAPRTRWRGELVPSLVAAAGMLVWTLFVSVLSTLLSAAGSGSSVLALRFQQLGEVAVLAVALTLAAFVSFWLVAPITARSSLPAVIGKALFAGLLAAVVLWPVEFVLLTGYFNQVAVEQAGGLYDLADLDPVYTPVQIAVMALFNGLQLVVARLPLLALAALALWWWLRRKESHGEA